MKKVLAILGSNLQKKGTRGEDSELYDSGPKLAKKVSEGH